MNYDQQVSKMALTVITKITKNKNRKKKDHESMTHE